MKKDVGRPTVVTNEVLHKLEEAFSMGCTDLEACVLANISKSTLYNYQAAHPEFLERKEELRENPILKARITVIRSLETDINSAWKYLERKDKSLHPKQDIDHTTDGEKITVQPIMYATQDTSQVRTEDVPNSTTESTG